MPVLELVDPCFIANSQVVPAGSIRMNNGSQVLWLERRRQKSSGKSFGLNRVIAVVGQLDRKPIALFLRETLWIRRVGDGESDEINAFCVEVKFNP